jgi:type IV pilus assembly protein PilW
LWDAQYGINVMGIPVQAYEIPAVVPSPTVPVCASVVVNPQPTTDVLVVRHVDTCIAGVDPGCTTLQPADVAFQVNRCVTLSTPPYSSPTFALGTTATLAATPIQQKDCATPAPAYKYVSNLYYVRNYSVTPGDGIPTLMRSQFRNGVHQTPDAMIEGVEGFRVELGLDTVSDSGGAVTSTVPIIWADPANLKSPTNRGDGYPDSYVHCTAAAPCTANQLMNAVSAKLYVLVRSENQTAGYTDTKSYCLASSCPTAADKLGPYNDHYKRHLFTQTVRLTNVSARRETPP